NGIAAGLMGTDILGNDLNLTMEQRGEALGGGLVNMTGTALVAGALLWKGAGLAGEMFGEGGGLPVEGEGFVGGARSPSRMDPGDFSGMRNYDYPLGSSDIGATGYVRTTTPWQRTVIERPGTIDW